jgi:hypothetical protein
MSVQYRVYVTPLFSDTVYSDEIEISDYVENVSGTITQSIDSTDFSVGIFTYTDVQITCDNAKGNLSDESDSRSIFKFSRDRAKVRVVFDQGETTPPVTYRGIINDSATTVNSDTDEISLTLLGPDSILINSLIPVGSVSDGMTVQQALIAILNSGDIRAVLGVSIANLNPSNNITIDDGSKFNNLNKKDGIIKLLSVSNSVMLIDDNMNIIVQNREHSNTNAITYLYGRGDSQGRENIISIQGYNTGLQRVFNSVLVTGGQPNVSVDAAGGGTVDVAQNPSVGSASTLQSQALYGLRQKAFTVDFITTLATLNDIAQGYVDEFSFPKIELQVTVPTEYVVNAKLLDLVSVNYPLLVTPSGKFLPVIGVTVIGDPQSPIPYSKGAISIPANYGFKIIEKTEDISSFETTLKLRQVGVSLTDGGLVVPLSTSPFILTNNQATPANVTGLIFDSTLYRGAIIIADVRRKTDTALSEVRGIHTIEATYNAQAGTWSMYDESTGDDDGTTFSITNAGQIQYVTTNITGTNGIHNVYYNAEVINA